MGGQWHAVLMPASDTAVAHAAALSASVIPLAPASGLMMMPVTDKVDRRIARETVATELVPGFYRLRQGLAEWARLLSAHGPVGYADMEFHGGTGSHAAIGWRDGQVDWGPRFTVNIPADADDPYEYVPEITDMAINGLLRWFGVDRGDELDEFLAVDLRRYRSTAEWDRAARRYVGERRNRDARSV